MPRKPEAPLPIIGQITLYSPGEATFVALAVHTMLHIAAGRPSTPEGLAHLIECHARSAQTVRRVLNVEGAERFLALADRTEELAASMLDQLDGQQKS